MLVYLLSSGIFGGLSPRICTHAACNYLPWNPFTVCRSWSNWSWKIYWNYLWCAFCVCRCELESVNNSGSNGSIKLQKTQCRSTAPLPDSTKSPSILQGRHKIQPPVLPYLSSVFQDVDVGSTSADEITIIYPCLYASGVLVCNDWMKAGAPATLKQFAKPYVIFFTPFRCSRTVMRRSSIRSCRRSCCYGEWHFETLKSDCLWGEGSWQVNNGMLHTPQSLPCFCYRLVHPIIKTTAQMALHHPHPPITINTDAPHQHSGLASLDRRLYSSLLLTN